MNPIIPPSYGLNSTTTIQEKRISIPENKKNKH